jgi:hypothetical protein
LKVEAISQSVDNSTVVAPDNLSAEDISTVLRLAVCGNTALNNFDFYATDTTFSIESERSLVIDI